MLAIVQENAKNHPSAANGMFMMVSFAVRSFAVVVVGGVGDMAGMENMFVFSAVVGFLSLPFLIWLPDRKNIFNPIIQENVMLKTNENRIVEMFMECRPGPPRVGAGWKVDHNGVPFLLPGIGGITLNVGVGDPAFGLAGDHIEPGSPARPMRTNPMTFPTIRYSFWPVRAMRPNFFPVKPKGKPGW